MSNRHATEHTPAPRGYRAFHAWAERKAKTHDQKQCPGCGLYVNMADEAPEANVRAALDYLLNAVERYATHSSLTISISNKQRVAELIVQRGPQVAEYDAQGLCLYCGKRKKEYGYFCCEDCLTRPDGGVS